MKTMQAVISGIGIRAARMRSTKGLRSELLERLNLDREEGLIEGVGVDTTLAAFEEIANRLLEINLYQAVMAGGDEPLTEEEIDAELDPAVLHFLCEVEETFSGGTGKRQYGDSRNVVPFVA